MKKEIFICKRDQEGNVIMIIGKLESEGNKFEIYLPQGIVPLDKVLDIIVGKIDKIKDLPEPK